MEQPRAAAPCPVLIRGSCFPVPFPGVKQEQLSPRSQASQPESLVLQPSQEGSILRGEEREGRVLLFSSIASGVAERSAQCLNVSSHLSVSKLQALILLEVLCSPQNLLVITKQDLFKCY